jgi:zinc transport system permease protein
MAAIRGAEATLLHSRFTGQARRIKSPAMLEPFLLRALLAGLGIAIVAAPLGCLVVWRRMSYFGSTVAHAGLLGVALGIAFDIDLTLGVIVVSLAVGALLVMLERQPLLPVDSLLGILSHAALALGLIAAARLSGQRLDLMGYLFGDILAVTQLDLVWIYAGGAVVLGVIALYWRTLVAIAVHKEMAAAEGHDTARAEAALIMLLAFIIAVAMKVVGVLLIVAFLIMPAAAARPFSATPEVMVLLAGGIGIIGTIGGLAVSNTWDVAAGPGVVVVLSAFCLASLATAFAVAKR